MRIPKKAEVTSEFHCTKYPDLNMIRYKVCIGRQLTKTPGQGWLYPECKECDEGKEILARFKDYKPEKRQRPNWNTTGCRKNVERKKRTCAEVDCLKCKTLLQAQIEYTIQLISEGKNQAAIQRLNIVLEEVCNI